MSTAISHIPRKIEVGGVALQLYLRMFSNDEQEETVMDIAED